MASEYTPNYNLDLYADSDKPNLRDQYNGAITKIDTQLHEFSNNMVIVTDAANQARDKASTAQAAADANAKSISTLNTTVTEVDSAYKTADTKLSSDLTAAYKAADDGVTSAYKAADNAVTSAYKAADTAISNAYAQADTNLNNTLTKLINDNVSTINAHFPIKSGDIQAGAITRDKLDAQALESLIKGITIRHFDSKDSTADNVGMVVPNSDVILSGFYLPELTMLVITMFHVPKGTPGGTFFQATTPFRLPSYVPHTTANNIKLNAIGVKSNSSSDFVSWTGIGMNKDGYIGTNSAVPSDCDLDMAGSAVVFLRAYGVA
jgi:hypothetical protein